MTTRKHAKGNRRIRGCSCVWIVMLVLGLAGCDWGGASGGEKTPDSFTATPVASGSSSSAAEDGSSGDSEEYGSGDAQSSGSANDGAASPPSQAPDATESAAPEPSAPSDAHATLIAVGDIMVHSQQLPAYYDAADDRYDFSPWFRKVKPILEQGDWVVGNLETPLAGKDLKYSGYPRFNAPPELADTLKDVGFQILSTANNHALDRGYIGAARTLGHLRGAGLVPVGTSVSRADAGRIVIEERNGIKLGFLSYTYGTNGIPIPKDKPYVVNLIDTDRIAADIRKLREAGTDGVVVSLHFGTEYQRMPNDSQRDVASKVIAAGADLIIGCHPHVVQPYDIVEVPDDSYPGGRRQGVILYSLGNFISAQKGDWKDVGVIAKLSLTKTTETDGTSRIRWDGVDMLPTWVHARTVGKKAYFTVLPLAETIAEHDDDSLSAADYKHLEALLNGLNRHVRTLTAASAG